MSSNIKNTGLLCPTIYLEYSQLKICQLTLYKRFDKRFIYRSQKNTNV